LTLFTNLGSVLKLADWARVLVQNWKAWTHAFWVWVFGWLGIHLPEQWAPVLSFLSFGSLLAIGQAFKYSRTIKTQPMVDKYKGRSYRLLSWRMFYCFTLMFIIETHWVSRIDVIRVWLDRHVPIVPFGYDIGWWFWLAPPVILVTVFAKQYRLHVAIVTLLVALFGIIISLHQLDVLPVIPLVAFVASVNTAMLIATAMISVLPLILLSLAPAKAISRRLIFLAIGLLLLIALNELSKLGLDVIAPKPQG
jgi:hypothetical protein